MTKLLEQNIRGKALTLALVMIFWIWHQRYRHWKQNKTALNQKKKKKKLKKMLKMLKKNAKNASTV